MRKTLVVMIAVFLALAFAIIVIPEDVSAQALGCCLETNNGDFCKSRVTKAACQEGFFYTGKACEDVQQCEAVTCISKVGACQANKVLFQCQSDGSRYDAREIEEVEECQKGGCNIGNIICEHVQERVCEENAINSGFTLDDVTFTPGIDEIEVKKQCTSGGRGTCELGGGDCSYTSVSECANQGGKFFNDVFPSDVNSCAPRNVKDAQGCGILAGDENKIFWFDDHGDQAELIEDCNYPKAICGEDEDEEGNTETVCKSTSCTFTLEEEDSEGRKGEYTLLSGTSMCYNFHTDLNGKSTGLQHQVLHCVLGEIKVEGLGADRDKICVDDHSDNKIKQFAMLEFEGTGQNNSTNSTTESKKTKENKEKDKDKEITLDSALVKTNLWEECRECGRGDGQVFGQLAGAFASYQILSPGDEGDFLQGGIFAGINMLSGDTNRIGDVFQLIPLAIPPGPWINTFVLGSACGGSEKLKEIKFIDDLAEDFGLCTYEKDLFPWGGSGSAVPRITPGNTQQCGSCGGGGDELWNVCDENECNAIGDCESKTAFEVDQVFSAWATASIALSAFKVQSCFLTNFGDVMGCWEEFGKTQSKFYDATIGELMESAGIPKKKVRAEQDVADIMSQNIGDTKKEILENENVLSRVKDRQEFADAVNSARNSEELAIILQNAGFSNNEALGIVEKDPVINRYTEGLANRGAGSITDATSGATPSCHDDGDADPTTGVTPDGEECDMPGMNGVVDSSGAINPDSGEIITEANWKPGMLAPETHNVWFAGEDGEHIMVKGMSMGGTWEESPNGKAKYNAFHGISSTATNSNSDEDNSQLQPDEQQGISLKNEKQIAALLSNEYSWWCAPCKTKLRNGEIRSFYEDEKLLVVLHGTNTGGVPRYTRGSNKIDVYYGVNKASDGQPFTMTFNPTSSATASSSEQQTNYFATPLQTVYAQELMFDGTPICGDGICNVEDGETPINCPEDCGQEYNNPPPKGATASGTTNIPDKPEGGPSGNNWLWKLYNQRNAPSESDGPNIPDSVRNEEFPDEEDEGGGQKVENTPIAPGPTSHLKFKEDKINNQIYGISKAIILGLALNEADVEKGLVCEPETALLEKGTELCNTCASEDGFRLCTLERCEILGLCQAVQKGDGTGYNCLAAPCDDPEGKVAPVIKGMEAEFFIGNKMIHREQGENTIDAGVIPWNATEILLTVETDVGASCSFSTKQGVAWADGTEFDKAKEYPKQQDVLLTAGGAGRTHNIYVKCQNICGKSTANNTDENFLVYQKGPLPDFFPPEVTKIDPENTFVPEEPAIVTTEIHISENGVCLYSRDINNFDANEMTEMECKQDQRCILTSQNNCAICEIDTDVSQGEIFDLTAFAGLPGIDETDLAAVAEENGMQDTKVSRFNFACRDVDGNRGPIMAHSLSTVRPINVTITGPEEGLETYDQEVTLTVETNHVAICKYSFGQKNYADMIDLAGELLTEHETIVTNLTEGANDIYVTCEDFALQQESDNIIVVRKVDRIAPILIRAYEDVTDAGGGVMRIITDDKSTCKYDTGSMSFAFEEGLEMPHADSFEHIADIGHSIYYVKCRDIFDNELRVVIQPGK